MNDDGDFPGHLLHQAALWDNEELLRDLLGGEFLAFINSRDSWGRTPLHAAATTDKSTCLPVLLAHGGDVSLASGAQDNFKTPLHSASEHGFLSNVSILVEHGADVTVLEGGGYTAADLAERGGHIETLFFLRAAGEAKEAERERLHNEVRTFAASGDVQKVSDLLEKINDKERSGLLNMTPNGRNSILLAAAEGGKAELVSLLLSYGADGRAHPVTKYSPLYVASYYGHVAVVDMLLQKFVQLIDFATVEKWLPIHAAAINGHLEVMKLLLEFSYPDHVLKSFATKDGIEYSMAFDINWRDVSGQTALFIAAQMGNSRLVDCLLQFKTPIKDEAPTPKISQGISNILSRLSLAANQSLETKMKRKEISPVEVDVWNEENLTPLHVAVRLKNHVISTSLLNAKADPNFPIIQPNKERSSCLAEACERRDLGMIDLLLKHGARDGDSRALRVVKGDAVIAGKLLALDAHPNENHIVDKLNALSINWHGKNLTQLHNNWLITASLKVNPRLRLCPRNAHMGLDAIIRLDLSGNEFESLPSSLFDLVSLRYLDLSGNKLTSLSFPSTIKSKDLEEISAAGNRLLNIPKEILKLSKLKSLDFSNNKIQEIPQELWECPCLSEVNLSLNMISNIAPNAKSATIETRKEKEEEFDGELERVTLWSSSLTFGDEEEIRTGALTSLNLSHNSFGHVPPVLACVAPSLQRLNLSYNDLLSLGGVSNYPAHVKYLDLSHNHITTWFNEDPDITCGEECNHKGHTKLEQLKTLGLAGNEFRELNVGSSSGLWFPHVTLLDLSENHICEITGRIGELQTLSVLQLSNNGNLVDLPPQLGLCHRLWNLNTIGCPLAEPLRSLVFRKGAKTLDVVNYLKSVLEDAKPYARMKLMLVGLQGIGKTTLLSQLREASGRSHTPDHWARRVGGKGNRGGKPMSTVGVDIGSLVIDLRKGPVTFRTWDFGGQHEYYATHLYFLSKRSLYLVIWNVCEGERGLSDIQRWLVNIQARAPNSPVIIIGTHLDLVQEKFPPGYLEHLQGKIREKFIQITDPEKRGLPKVVAHIEISTHNRSNVRSLVSLIYETALSLKVSGRRMLEVKVPWKYLMLEEMIGILSSDRREKGLEPVLSADQMRNESWKIGWRDESELWQACGFLHDNGIILHYEDAALKDFFFIDPQWLCDLLSRVVSVREVNPFAPNGIMRSKDLPLLFKGTPTEYVVDLLAKFELAVAWDASSLLIPSLLPPEHNRGDVRIGVPVRSRGLFKKRSNSSEDCSSPEIIPGKALSRYLLVAYFPCGFWSRLICRLLSDDHFVEGVRNYFDPLPPSDLSAPIIKALENKAEWVCWETGVELTYGQLVLLRVREASEQRSFLLRRDDAPLAEDIPLRNEYAVKWDPVEPNEGGILELKLPCESLKFPNGILKPGEESTAKLLALVVDHIDTLLEDWYPSIGTRFVHTSEGRYLVTRLVPCPSCVAGIERGGRDSVDSGNHSVESVEQNLHPGWYAWSVEWCIAEAQKQISIAECPAHGIIGLEALAPDTLFLDLSHKWRISPQDITRQQLIGRGAFGFVFGGWLVKKYESGKVEVAIKTFSPVHPGQDGEAEVAFRVAESKWARAPGQSACRAYMAARGEVRVLSAISHPNVVLFLGLAQRPLAIVMPRAPKGALDGVLQDFKRCGARVKAETLKEALLCIARALEFLHANHVVYRDLKAENVLVWKFPLPFGNDLKNVDLKLTDYGISRSGFGGVKGFGGTEGFMAPEIIRYNGEEEYTEKVDIFSFGMVLYEMLTLRQPFQGHDNLKEALLEGSRPHITLKESEFPTRILDLMVLCWAQDPRARPSATQIIEFVSTKEFTLLRDAVTLTKTPNVVSALAVQYGACREVWASCSIGGVFCLGLRGEAAFAACRRFDDVGVVTAMALVNENVWMGDTNGCLHIYRVRDFGQERIVELEDSVGSCGAIVAIKGIGEAVAVGAASGRLFLCSSSTGNVFSELGRSSTIHALAVRMTPEGMTEVWSGEDKGGLGVYQLKDSIVLNEERVSHFEPQIPEVQVLLVEAGDSLLFTYVYPGSIVYCWEAGVRELVGRVDIGGLVDTEEETPLHVTTLNLAGPHLYIGTNWGFLFVTESETLRPLTSFRPFQGDVRALTIFSPPLSEEEVSWGIVGIGKGLTSMLHQEKEEMRRKATAVLLHVLPNSWH